MKRDYAKSRRTKAKKRRRFENPYYRQEKASKAKPIILGTLGLLLIGFGLHFFLRSDFLTIERITVAGIETIEEQEIQRIARDVLAEPRWIISAQSNRIAFQASRMEEALSRTFSFETLEMRVKGDTLQLTISEKASQLLWFSDDDIVLVDQNGLAIRRLTGDERTELFSDPPPPTIVIGEETNEEGEVIETEVEVPPELPRMKQLPRFIDLNALDISIGEPVLTEEEVANIFIFHDRLRTMDIAFLETRIDRLAGKWMSVVTEAGYDILFDPTGNIDQQGDNLLLTIHDPQVIVEDLDYIDLRFGDHVYYK